MAWTFLHEVGRKVFHFTILLVLIAFFQIKDAYSEELAFLFLVIILVGTLLFEYVRLDLNVKMPFFHLIIRPKEQQKLTGTVYFLSSTIICLAVFPLPIALAALLMTTFGDATAALVGKKYGTMLLFRDKTVIGFLAELVMNIVVAIVLSFYFSVNMLILLVMAFVAAGTETMIDELDDNLMIPIVAGLAGTLLMMVL